MFRADMAPLASRVLLPWRARCFPSLSLCACYDR